MPPPWSLVAKWLTYDAITEHQALWLKDHTTTCPRIYGLSKLHKQDHPLNTIVVFKGAPRYNLGKFLSFILQNVNEKSATRVNNSAEYASFLQHLKLPPDHIQVSFDATSLYTSVQHANKRDKEKMEWNSKIHCTAARWLRHGYPSVHTIIILFLQ